MTATQQLSRDLGWEWFEKLARLKVMQVQSAIESPKKVAAGERALLISYIVARQAVRGWKLLGFLATAPLAIPGIVLGVGLFLAYTRPPLTLYGTLWILLIAFMTIELPAAYQQFRSAFHAVHPELEEAGRMLGATRLRTLWDITGPLLRASVIAT